MSLSKISIQYTCPFERVFVFARSGRNNKPDWLLYPRHQWILGCECWV